MSAVQDLRGHVQRRPNNRIHHGVLAILQVFSKSKVAYFTTAILKQNIGGLEIAVSDTK